MKCIVKNCFNTPGHLKPGISFHRLPQCQIKRKIWLDNLGWKQRAQPSKYSIVCSEHFSMDSFYYSNKSNMKSRLHDNAFPNVVGKGPVDGKRPCRNDNDQRQTDSGNRKTSQYKVVNNLNSSSVANQHLKGNNALTQNTVKHKNDTVPRSTAHTPNSSLNKHVIQLPNDAPKKLTEQILVQLSNLDTQNLKSVINNSNAKFESALQAQARKKFRSELRKKLRNFSLSRDQTVNNVTITDMIDSGRISSDVLKKIEEVFSIDILDNESHEEASEVVDESEGDEDIGSNSNDVLSDTYMLLVKYGLIPSIPEIAGPEIDETNKKSSNDLPKTNIIDVDELPSVPLVYEDSSNNISNDDVILIEPRREIITIGSPEHEVSCDEIPSNEDWDLLPDNEPTEHLLNNDDHNETEPLLQVAGIKPPGLPNMTSLIENNENYLCSSILIIIKEYNENLQKCYNDKKEIDAKIATLQSQRDNLESTIAEIQTTQTKVIELFLRKSNMITESQISNEVTLPGEQTRKRKLSSNSSISSPERNKQLQVETNSNSIDSTIVDNSNSKQCAMNSKQKTNLSEHTRNHLSEVKDIIKTNDYIVVSAGSEILRYSCNNLELEKVYKRHRALVTGVYVLNNEYVFSVSLDMNLHKFSLEGFQNPLSTNCFKESLTALEYGWNTLFIGSARGRIIAFSIETNKICLDFNSDVKNSISILKTVELLNKKSLTVLCVKSLYLYICDALTGFLIKTIDTFNYINDISIDNDSIYCGLNSNELLTFSIFSGRSHNPKELDTKSTIKCVKTYKNLVLVGCCDGYIHVYHKSTNFYLDLVRVTDKGLINFEVFPRKIVFCSGDKSLTINDMPQQIMIYIE